MEEEEKEEEIEEEEKEKEGKDVTLIFVAHLCIIVRGVEDFSTESNSFMNKNSNESQSPKPFHPSASV